VEQMAKASDELQEVAMTLIDKVENFKV